MRLVGVALLVGALALDVHDARACGGLFCNAVNPTPVIQAGERVLFARHDGLVTMHIEIVYQGDPTQFGWLLPVPDPPKDSDGNPLPLERAVSISPQGLFANLQRMTDPQFQSTVRFEGNGCFATADATASFTAAQDSSSSTTETSVAPPPVVVLEEARVGPYNAQLIHADDADALFTWLADNGYQQDAAARLMLEHYVRMGFEFVGIRLQSGKTTDALRPLALVLGEDAPCVPLKLTAIAAAADMPILVWVLGPGRAVPKNFIHARLNPMAFAYPGGGNYQSLVSQAIDTASGRAWVTELSAPSSDFSGAVPAPPWVQATVAAIDSPTALAKLLEGVSQDPDVLAVLRDEIARPEGMRGYPYGSCYYCTGCGTEQCPDTNEAHLTTDAELYGYLDYWLRQPGAGGLTLDLERVKRRLIDEVIAPRVAVAELFDETATLTRFYTTLDPSEMTRDPIFAFNPDLPPVSNIHNVSIVVRQQDCSGSTRAVTYEDGRTVVEACSGFCGGSVQPVPGQDVLLGVEVLDETGAPVVFAKSQVAEVDRIMDGALLGVPTLPPTFEAETPERPPVPPGFTPSSRNNNDGCASTSLAWWLLVPLVLGLRRRP